MKHYYQQEEKPVKILLYPGYRVLYEIDENELRRKIKIMQIKSMKTYKKIQKKDIKETYYKIIEAIMRKEDEAK